MSDMEIGGSLSIHRRIVTFKSGKVRESWIAEYLYQNDDGTTQKLTLIRDSREELWEAYRDYCRNILDIERRTHSFDLLEQQLGEGGAA